MKIFIDFLNENPWTNLVFLILAILSIIVSIILYFKSKKHKKSAYILHSTNIFTSKMKLHGNIEVTYCDEKVENLTISKLGFWNNGNDVINETDFAPTDMLKIIIDKNFEILDVNIIFTSKDANNVSCSHDTKEIDIKFDYFDSLQGFVIKIIHTGLKSSNLKLCGSIKGSPKISKTRSYNFNIFSSILITLPLAGTSIISTRSSIKTQRLFPYVIFISGIICILLPLIFNITDEGRFAFMIGGGLYAFLGIITILTTKKIPKGFEILYEDE